MSDYNSNDSDSNDSDSSDDYLKDYILEDHNTYSKIDDRYYQEVNNKEKMVDFLRNNSGFGRVVIHHFILYQDKEGIFLFYIHKEDEEDSYYVKYDIYRVKYKKFEENEIEYATKNHIPYQYDLIIQSMRECYLQERMVNKNCLDILEWNPKLKLLKGMKYLNLLTGLSNQTMCCQICHTIAQDDKFFDHFVYNEVMKCLECINTERYCPYYKYCQVKNTRTTIEEHVSQCENKKYICTYDGCSYCSSGSDLLIHGMKCQYKPRTSFF